MDRPTAEKLAAALAKLDAQFNEVVEIVETIEDVAENKELRRALGEAMCASMDTLWPLIRQYPDLDPDKDTQWYKDREAKRAARKSPPESDA
jgi:Zn-dependent oligopeptidase